MLEEQFEINRADSPGIKRKLDRKGFREIYISCGCCTCCMRGFECEGGEWGKASAWV